MTQYRYFRRFPEIPLYQQKISIDLLKYGRSGNIGLPRDYGMVTSMSIKIKMKNRGKYIEDMISINNI